MKRPLWPTAPTSKRALRADRNAAGGVTLETALVLPMFALLAFFLIYLIQLSVVSMALHGAVSQTAREAAAWWYPVSLGVEQFQSTELYARAEQWQEKGAKAGELLQSYGHLLPSPMKEWAEQATAGRFAPDKLAAGAALTPLLRRFADSRVLDEDKIVLKVAELPGGSDRVNAFVSLIAEYELPLRLPFVGRRPILLRQTARERAWIGGSPSVSRLADDSREGLEAAFVSLEPNPVRPGRKATLVIRTSPGAIVDLSVLYKSGLSQAKHLGRATADASGIVSWTWHVSGRTTPGQWSLQASGEGLVWRHPFDVAGKK